MDSSSPPLILPRGLILLAFFWLVGCWLLSVGLRPPVYPSAASYEPGIRKMLIAAMIGLMVGWPLYRLSQPRSLWPLRQTLLDLVVLLSMAQVVIWPLRLVTTWTRERTAAMDATLIGWTLLAGAIVAAAIGTARAGTRILAMAVCIALCLFSPMVTWLSIPLRFDPAVFGGLSPLLSIHSLGLGRGSDVPTHEWATIALLAVVAVGAWTALLAAALCQRGPRHSGLNRRDTRRLASSVFLRCRGGGPPGSP